MKIERIWAMPNKNTFDIPPIKTLLTEEMGGGWSSVDRPVREPFKTGKSHQ